MQSVVEILVSSDQSRLGGSAFKTVRVSVHSVNRYDDTFESFIRRVDFDKVPAMLGKLEAKYDVSPTSHHREQFEIIAQKRAAVLAPPAVETGLHYDPLTRSWSR